VTSERRPSLSEGSSTVASSEVLGAEGDSAVRGSLESAVYRLDGDEAWIKGGIDALEAVDMPCKSLG